jgi:integral membrane protein
VGVLNSAIGRLRLVGYAEGASFMLLLGVAMPLKYAAGMREAAFWPGLVHGLLFVLYVAAVAHAYRAGELARRLAGWALVASVLPAGPFVLDTRLRKPELAPEPAEASGPV